MNEIVKMFHDQPVRIMDSNGEPWFIAKDVCHILEIKQTSRAVEGLDNDEKGVINVHTLGGEQKMLVINEPGLYTLTLRSRKPQAQEFRRWITHEVIPGIRKNGAYVHPGADFNGLVQAVVAAQGKEIIPVIVQNLEMKAEIHYLRNFEPEGNVGDISGITGLPKMNWQRARYTSGRGRPYQQLIDSCRQAELPGLFERPLLSAPTN